jgi:hypothetical protein
MSLKKLAKQVQQKGRRGDTELVHMTRGEVAGLGALAKAATGRSLPRNPDTGLPEASVLKQWLPTILGAAATVMTGGAAAGVAAGALAGAATNKDNPLMGAAMGAMGGYGGGQLATGLMGAGASAAANAAPAATGSALPSAATNVAPQAGMSMAAPTAATAVPADAVAQSAMEQIVPAAAPTTGAVPATSLQVPGVTPAMQGPMSVAQQTPQAMIQGADAAGRAGYAMDGFKSLGSMDGINGFIGTAGDKAAGTAATGMGGGYEAMMAAGRASVPALMATPESSGGGEEDYGEMPKYRYDRNYTGGRRLEGSGFTSQRDWFDDSFTKLAAGGGVPPPNRGNDRPPAESMPAPPPSGGQGKPPEALWVMRPYGPGTSPGGMSGQSRDAFEYLMGRSSGRAPAPPAAPPAAPPVAPPPSTGGGGVGGIGGGMDGPTRGGGIGMPMGGRQHYGMGLGMGGGSGMDMPGYGGAVGRGQYDYGGFGDDYLLQDMTQRRRPNMSDFAEGGAVDLESGGFVIPADVVAAAGAGSSNAGMEALAKRLGAKPISGGGDGQSDSIPASIDGKHKARVARDEMMLTRQQVEQIGGGDGSKGAKKLYAMMERIRKQATGHTKQMRPVKLDKALK